MPELLNIAASNKLLKIIEEPPGDTLFLLVANDHEQLLTTILSRTQIVKFNRLSAQDIITGLQQKRQLPPDRAQGIAKIADGNFTTALTLSNEDQPEDENFTRFVAWMRLCFRKDVKGVIYWVDEIAGTGREKQKALLHYGLHIFRECMIGNYASEELIRLDGAQLDFAGKFSNFIKGSNILQLNELFNEAHYHVDRNANPKILFLDVSFKLFRVIHQ